MHVTLAMSVYAKMPCIVTFGEVLYKVSTIALEAVLLKLHTNLLMGGHSFK